MSQKDYYDVLGIKRDATLAEIKTAFRRLAKKYHPDVSKESGAEAKFKEVNEAYHVLSDDKKRKLYDQFGHEAAANNHPGGGGFGGFEDIFSHFSNAQSGARTSGGSGFGGGFEDIFSFFGGGGHHNQQRANVHHGPQKGANIFAETTINIKELLFGTKIELKVNLLNNCEKCNGTGAETPSDIHTCKVCNGSGAVLTQQRTLLGVMQTQKVCPNCKGIGKVITNKCTDCRGKKQVEKKQIVTIDLPHSLQLDQQVLVRGMGHAGINRGPSGDIYLAIKLQPNKYFSREGNNLVLSLPVTYLDAILGNKVTIPSLDGNILVKLAAGTKENDEFIIPKYGFFLSQRSNKRANLIVRVKIKLPIRLSSEDKKMLNSIRDNKNFVLDNSKINDFNIQT